MQLMDWEAVKSFVLVAREGSLVRAGKRLGVNSTTIGRRIEGLETTLGLRLIQRTKRGYVLSEDGEQFLAEVRQPAEQLLRVDSQLNERNAPLEGRVHIRTPKILSHILIHPLMLKLAEENREIELSVLETPGWQPPITDDVTQLPDLMLTLLRPTGGDLLIRKVGDLSYGLYATEAYLSEYGYPSDPGDLDGHRFIAFEMGAPPAAPVWFVERCSEMGKIAIRADDPWLRIAAANANLGLAILPISFASREQHLTLVFGPEQIGKFEVWTSTPNDLPRVTRVQTVLHLLNDLARERME